jgi:adenylate cyclase class 2
MENQEIEVRFLEIDKKDLIQKLNALGATDLGEDMLEEIIIYDKELTWRDGAKKLLRLRTRKGKTVLTFKEHRDLSSEFADEIEFEVSDIHKAEALLERLGYTAYRQQQKLRHTFHLGEVVVDIDTWPRIPPCVELEGPSVESLKVAAAALDLDWKDVVTDNARVVIENVYKIPVGHMRWFTFDRFE